MGPQAHSATGITRLARGDGAHLNLPDRDSLIGLVGAVLAEQHDEWTEGRRYLGCRSPFPQPTQLIQGEAKDTNDEPEETEIPDAGAFSA